MSVRWLAGFGALITLIGGCFSGLATAAQPMRYTDCIALVDRDANAAYEAAVAWRDSGGGARAQHCAALALVARNQFAEAGSMLEDLAHDLPLAPGDTAKRAPMAPEQAASLLAQAGNAWLMAQNADRAHFVFSEALSLSAVSNTARGELYIDRSRANADLDAYDEALRDLNRAAALLGPRGDILVYRAAAHRALGDVGAAQEDVERALAQNPGSPGALFERGNLKFALGDAQEAKADWQLVMDTAPNSPEAELAARNMIAAARREEQALDGSNDAPGVLNAPPTRLPPPGQVQPVDEPGEP